MIIIKVILIHPSTAFRRSILRENCRYFNSKKMLKVSFINDLVVLEKCLCQLVLRFQIKKASLRGFCGYI